MYVIRSYYAGVPASPGGIRRKPRAGAGALRAAAAIEVAAPFSVVLINPYELGRQPFALAEPAALLKRAGFAVRALDLCIDGACKYFKIPESI